MVTAKHDVSTSTNEYVSMLADPLDAQYKSDHLVVNQGPVPSQGSISYIYQMIKWPRHIYKGILLGASAMAPLAALLWCIFSIPNELRTKDNHFLTGSILGGHLTLLQAKAFDFVCSALLAPTLMLLLNLLWFDTARISAVNEKGRQGVPLAALAELSNTDSGTYNPLKIAALMKGRTRRLFLFSLLVLSSAIANTALSNTIAYQAYTAEESGVQRATLRMMKDSSIDAQQGFGSDIEMAMYSYTTSQQSEIANQLSGLLTGLDFQDATRNLDGGTAYIGTNATARSMNTLDQTTVALKNVPGYRLSVDCWPDQPGSFGMTAMGSYQTSIMINFKDRPIFFAGIPGLPAEIQGPTNDMYQLAGFRLDGSEVFLGYLTSFNQSTSIVSSTFGNVQPSVFNMTASGFSGTKSIMTLWGVRCSIFRQEGFLNYTRSPGAPWKISHTQFHNEKIVVPSFLAAWQVNLNYHAPQSTIAGIGPALATAAYSPLTQNFSIFALNYLYTSGEVQRMQYEIAASNSSRDLPEYFYDVDTTVQVQHYRITYIPLIFIVGVATMSIAALITSAMAIQTRNTLSARTNRDLDVLRLVVDSVTGLSESAEGIAVASRMDRTRLGKWAEGYQVRYSEVVDNDGIANVRLFHSGGTTANK